MPSPTILVPYGEASDSSNLFAVVELDAQENLDPLGESISEFYDNELVYILVHKEPGAIIKDISMSLGNIINPDSPVPVSRTNTIENVVFKGKDETYTLPHIPSGGINITWKGRARGVDIIERVVTCRDGAGIADISYTYTADQYTLEMSSLDIEDGGDFPVEVSFNIEV